MQVVSSIDQNQNTYGEQIWNLNITTVAQIAFHTWPAWQPDFFIGDIPHGNPTSSLAIPFVATQPFIGDAPRCNMYLVYWIYEWFLIETALSLVINLLFS